MTYLFVPAYVNIGRAKGPRRAVVWHMAEGGGTVGYLAKANPNGVSVHAVIERTGRIVQMLPWDHAHTSIRIRYSTGRSALRSTDDPAFTWRGATIRYGATAAKAVLGAWARTETTLGPNHASIAVEVEGYADDGPNDKQKDAIARLWGELRRMYPEIRSLGHRDFNSYKACPGKAFPWDEAGGHGPAAAEDDMHIDFKVERWTLDGGPGQVTTLGAPRRADGTIDWNQRLALLSGTGGVNPRLELIARSRLGVPYSADLDDEVYGILASYRLPPADCAPAANAAYNEALAAAAAAVTKVPRR